ncbi:MAG: hypothetical protein HY903_01700 [Deltaproteobacteria bacterium]|nr:hypothetical protein [Deltaproteobacteria bacterium]
MSPFVSEQPVVGTGKYFGREQLGRSLYTGVGRGRSFAVVGGAKTGRTSTLLQLKAQLELSFKRDPKATRLVPALVDLEPESINSAATLATAIYSAITKAVADPKVYGNALPVRVPELTVKRGDDPFAQLCRTLAAYGQALQGTAGWCQYLLLVDNADRLLSPALETCAAPVATLVAASETFAPRALVLAAGRPLRELLNERDGPLTGVRPLFLGALRDSEARALIEASCDAVDMALADEVLAQSGKHPYLMQLLLAEYERHQFNVDADLVLAAVRPHTDRLFTRLWDELDLGRGVTYRGAYAAPEHALMQHLIERGDAVDLRVVERDLGIKPLKEFAELLEYCGVVERILVGDNVRFQANGRLWNEWYAARIRR